MVSSTPKDNMSAAYAFDKSLRPAGSKHSVSTGTIGSVAKASMRKLGKLETKLRSATDRRMRPRATVSASASGNSSDGSAEGLWDVRSCVQAGDVQEEDSTTLLQVCVQFIFT